MHSCYSQQVLYCGNDKEVYSIKCQDFKGEKVVKDKVWQGADAVGLIEYKGEVRVVKKNGQLESLKKGEKLL